MHKIASIIALLFFTAANAAEYSGIDVGDAFAIAQRAPYVAILSHGGCKIGDSVIPGDVRLTLIDTDTHAVSRGCVASKDGSILALFTVEGGKVAIFNITGLPFKKFEYL